METTLKFRTLLLVASISILGNSYSHGQEKVHESNAWQVWAGITLYELYFIANSTLASESPQGYGIAKTLFTAGRYAFSERDGLEQHLWLATGMTTGLYNLVELRRDKYSKTDVFVRNMISWNILVGTRMLADRYFGQGDSLDNIIFGANGSGFSIGMKFTFK